MSDKKVRKVVEEYAILREEYNKLYGIDCSNKKTQKEILSQLSTNAIKIEDIELDILVLQSDIEIIKNLPEENTTKNKKKQKHK